MCSSSAMIRGGSTGKLEDKVIQRWWDVGVNSLTSDTKNGRRAASHQVVEGGGFWTSLWFQRGWGRPEEEWINRQSNIVIPICGWNVRETTGVAIHYTNYLPATIQKKSVSMFQCVFLCWLMFQSTFHNLCVFWRENTNTHTLLSYYCSRACADHENTISCPLHHNRQLRREKSCRL